MPFVEFANLTTLFLMSNVNNGYCNLENNGGYIYGGGSGGLENLDRFVYRINLGDSTDFKIQYNSNLIDIFLKLQ